MAGSRGKNRATTETTDLNKLAQARIEERNYLISSLADWKPTEIKELWTWSVEALYQFILANNIKGRKQEANNKNQKNGIQTKHSRKRER